MRTFAGCALDLSLRVRGIESWGNSPWRLPHCDSSGCAARLDGVFWSSPMLRSAAFAEPRTRGSSFRSFMTRRSAGAAGAALGPSNARTRAASVRTALSGLRKKAAMSATCGNDRPVICTNAPCAATATDGLESWVVFCNVGVAVAASGPSPPRVMATFLRTSASGSVRARASDGTAGFAAAPSLPRATAAAHRTARDGSFSRR